MLLIAREKFSSIFPYSLLSYLSKVGWDISQLFLLHFFDFWTRRFQILFKKISSSLIEDKSGKGLISSSSEANIESENDKKKNLSAPRAKLADGEPKTNGILRSRVCLELHEGRKLPKAVCRVNNIPSLRSFHHEPLSIRVEILPRVWQLSNCLRLSAFIIEHHLLNFSPAKVQVFLSSFFHIR